MATLGPHSRPASGSLIGQVDGVAHTLSGQVGAHMPLRGIWLVTREVHRPLRVFISPWGLSMTPQPVGKELMLTLVHVGSRAGLS